MNKVLYMLLAVFMQTGDKLYTHFNLNEIMLNLNKQGLKDK